MKFHHSQFGFLFRLGLALAAGLLHELPSAKAEEILEFYNGARQMGMGGAAIAVVNDETALMLNPAGLGKLRDYILTVADPEIETSSNAISLAGVDAMNMMKPQPMLNKLNQTSNHGKRLHLKGHAFPSVVVPNFGFGLYGKYMANGKVNDAGTDFEYNYRNDVAAVFGFNFRLFDGMVKLGATARAMNRVEVRRTDIPSSSTGLSINSLAAEGAGLGGDIGLILAAPVATLPTLAATWRDVGGTSYGLKEGMFTSAVTIPTHTRETVDVAVAFFPILSNRTRMSVTAEYRDILTMGKESDHMRRTHAGLEVNVADSLFLRAGMNQRYWTAGLEIAMGNYQLQAASYGEEVGTSASTEEDRRYVLKFGFRF